MVHSERILKYELINSSTTKIYMKKSVSLCWGYLDF